MTRDSGRGAAVTVTAFGNLIVGRSAHGGSTLCREMTGRVKVGIQRHEMMVYTCRSLHSILIFPHTGTFEGSNAYSALRPPNDIMSSPTTSPDPASHERSGRGRGRSRGGLGKYLRARGRRGYGRPAEFNKRLLLEGEGPPLDDEEAEQVAANAIKYSRRQLGSNADRYEEPGPEWRFTCLPLF